LGIDATILFMLADFLDLGGVVMRWAKKLFLLAAVTCAMPASAALVHDFRFDGDLTDQLGGPAAINNGGVLGATGITFGLNQGPTLNNILTANVYSVEFAFSLNITNGYRKILDFKGLTNDAGLYVLSDRLDFYPITAGIPNIGANQLVSVVLTRNAAGVVTGYVNGSQQITFTDSGNQATFSEPMQSARFFQDDNATGGNEASRGFVDYIRIYDTALSSGEVGGLVPPGVNAVPEPATWGMMIIGFGLVGGTMRRRVAKVTYA
jgi:Concanavalin A-like lectin/glucanases superfamily/PEP-CTERM motif